MKPKPPIREIVDVELTRDLLLTVWRTRTNKNQTLNQRINELIISGLEKAGIPYD